MYNKREEAEKADEEWGRAQNEQMRLFFSRVRVKNEGENGSRLHEWRVSFWRAKTVPLQDR